MSTTYNHFENQGTFKQEVTQRPEWLDEQLYPFQCHFQEMPALLIFGDQDGLVKLGWLARLERIFPRHRSIVMQGCHHFPQEYDPAGVATAILSFWDEEIESGGHYAISGRNKIRCRTCTHDVFR